MTQYDSQQSDADREALAGLVARFSADRDALAAAVQRAEAGLRELAARVDAVTARANEALPANELGPMRFEVGRLESLVESTADELRRLAERVQSRPEEASFDAATSLPAVAALQGAVERMAAELAQQAAGQDEARSQLVRAIDDVRRAAVSSGERATQALAQVADLERRSRDLDAVRGAVGLARDEFLRRIDETEARFGVRLDSIVAGVEAETRTVRDSTWDRMANVDQRLQDAELALGSMRAGLPQSVTRALEGLAAVRGEMDQLRQQLAATATRLATLEQGQRPRSVFECVRDEIVAAVMTVASIGAVFGRLALSLVR